MTGLVRSFKCRIQIAYLLVLLKICVQRDRLKQQTAGFKALGGGRGVFEVVAIKRRGLAIEASLLQRIGGRGKVTEQLGEDVSSATVPTEPQLTICCLTILLSELLLKLRGVPLIHRPGPGDGAGVVVGVSCGQA